MAKRSSFNTMGIAKKHIEDRIPDPIFEVDENYIITFANQNARERFKSIKEGEIYRPGCLYGKSSGEEDCIIEQTFRKKSSQTIDLILDKDVICEVKTDYYKVNDSKRVVVFIRDITERKKAWKDLRETRNYLQNLVESSPQIIITVDIDRNIVEFNKAAEEAFGYKKEEVEGENVGLLYNDPSEGKLINKKLQTEGEFKGEITNVRKDGTIFYTYLSASPLKDVNDEIVGFMGISHDITERKNAEEALKRSEERYRRLVDLNPAAIAVHCEGKIVYANEASVKLMGASSDEEVLGKPILDFVHPDFTDIVKERVRISQEEGECVETIEEKFIKLNGDNIDVEVTAIPITYRNKPASQVVFWDITERKSVVKALKESERKYRRLADNIQDGLVVVENDKIVYVNDRACDIFGYDRDELLELEMFRIAAPEEKERLRDLRKDIIEKGEDIDELEFWIVRKDGEYRYVNNRYSKRTKNDGIVNHFIVTTDITERKKAEEALKESEKKYRALLSNVPVGIFRSSIKGEIVSVNPALVILLGYQSRDEILGVSTLDMYVDLKRRDDYINELKNNSIVNNFEAQLYKKDGSKIWVSLNARLIEENENGEKYIDGILEDITEQKNARRELKISFKRLEKSLEGTIHAISKIVEIKDPYTSGHQIRVAELAKAIAEEMEISENKVDCIYMAGVVHDIGKISIPHEILTKPGELTELELNIIKTHPQIGYDILRNVKFPWPISEIVLQHHEYLDGSGYPAGLKGDEILDEAKILCVADVVEAMSSHRPYRPVLGLDKAIEEISRNRGKLYDPEIVDACISILKNNKFKFN